MIDLKELAISKFNTPPTENDKGHFVVDPFIGSIFLAVKKYKEKNKNILIYTANNFEATEIFNALLDFVDKDDLVTIPSDELLRVEYLNESKQLLAEQIYGLYSLRKAMNKIIILSPSTLYRFLPFKEVFDASCFTMKIGNKFNLENLKKSLIQNGYEKVSKIDQSLQFAIRGDIVDIFSLNYENPIRIEFFDDEVESIRFFNISNQVSFKEVNEVEILPATLNLFDEEERKNGIIKIKKQLKEDSQFLSNQAYAELQEIVDKDIEDLESNFSNSRLSIYSSLIREKYSNILDFINDYEIIIENEDEFFRARDSIFEDSHSFLEELYREGRAIGNLKYFDSNANIFRNALKISYLNSFYIHEESKNINITSNSFFSSRDINLVRLFSVYFENNYKIMCLVENKEQLNKIISACENSNIKSSISRDFLLDEESQITVAINSFAKGFEFKDEKIVILTSKELFGYRRHVSTYSSKFREGIILNSYQDLEPGDYVVHEKSGIGRFVKISTLELDGKHEDYLEIQYDGTDVLFVPLYQFSLVRKYVGKDGYVPKLNKLHSTRWESTKKKIKERINDLAERLMTLYNSRAQIKGNVFEPLKEIEDEFANDFEYELTKDQKRSLEEIFKDMEEPRPMDRLLCGDVGFGKTEIALRAAFRCILNNKLVIFICPTTLLAKQHYELALKRFKKFDVNVALYTRMCTPNEAKNIEKSVDNNKINLLIGTHKALSSKLNLSNLGLLIIDEEQRFGVEQKEKIKEKCNGIDVLTLSATPIPRTLQSSLIGLKQVSTIETPPKERMAIQTYVIPYDQNVVRELIKRELSRHGQIFYVHNEVASIYDTCERLLKLVPECKIGIVHGQMNKEDSINVMQDFYDGKIDLLLATSIIENGIDVENANLMLIENANAFGLAQLYQIKGRVGRGDRMAFAYLMINKNKEINEAGQKRLEAIQDLSSLGSGYKIAQRDLLIRGAGDILGPEQAGFIDAIGIDMYIKLLNETIEEKKNGIKIAQEIKIKKDLGIDGYIPSYYIADSEKVEVYQKLLDCKTFEQLEETRKSLRDIYGIIPKSTELLFAKKKIDIYLEMEEFAELNEYQDRIDLILSYKFSDIEGIGSSLFTALIPYLKNLKISFINKRVNINITKSGEWVELLIKIFEVINELYIATIRTKENYENG